MKNYADLNLHNSSYHTQPHPITQAISFPKNSDTQLKQKGKQCWIDFNSSREQGQLNLEIIQASLELVQF